MKRLPEVESVMTQVEFSRSRVEKYFNKARCNDQQLRQRFSSDFENIACQSIHIIAKGFVQVCFGNPKESARTCIDIPTSAHFLVTGVRTYTLPYRVTFAVSLS